MTDLRLEKRNHRKRTMLNQLCSHSMTAIYEVMFDFPGFAGINQIYGLYLNIHNNKIKQFLGKKYCLG